jgi:hypothetical protein
MSYEIPEDRPISLNEAVLDAFEKEDDPYFENVVEPFLREMENHRYEIYQANSD